MSRQTPTGGGTRAHLRWAGLPRPRAAPEAAAPPVATRTAPAVPSRLAARYLYPQERLRGEWHRHPVHVAGPVTAAVAATVLVGAATGHAAAIEPLVEPYAAPTALATLGLLLWAGVVTWAGWQVAQWRWDRFILTNRRIMVVGGIIARSVAMLPLQRVTDMKYEQSLTGRLLRYGTFVIESAGQDQALREIPHLPDPNALYLLVVAEMYEPRPHP